ncbi:hypothetical protein I7I51_04137 [Histoplasma capsulatum]|uniref:Uncharacterized protein n=1 Tax=Ajellomyces capsulatus TaxID=5037 RepID=A0A8A1M9N3_AJECA|nr:hypothetical protein I7I51_04137 [Histoplasma capsulatum]
MDLDICCGFAIYVSIRKHNIVNQCDDRFPSQALVESVPFRSMNLNPVEMYENGKMSGNFTPSKPRYSHQKTDVTSKLGAMTEHEIPDNSDYREIPRTCTG